jgi:hypothetical protein
MRKRWNGPQAALQPTIDCKRDTRALLKSYGIMRTGFQAAEQDRRSVW